MQEYAKHNEPVHPTQQFILTNCILLNLVLLQMSLPEIGIYWDDINLWIVLAVIVFNPIYWNTVSFFDMQLCL